MYGMDTTTASPSSTRSGTILLVSIGLLAVSLVLRLVALIGAIGRGIGAAIVGTFRGIGIGIAATIYGIRRGTSHLSRHPVVAVCVLALPVAGVLAVTASSTIV